MLAMVVLNTQQIAPMKTAVSCLLISAITFLIVLSTFGVLAIVTHGGLLVLQYCLFNKALAEFNLYNCKGFQFKTN